MTAPPAGGPPEGEPLVLVIRAGPAASGRGRPGVQRLRAVLKGLLREAGWKVVELKEHHPTPYFWTPGEGI